jgi:hypothetical protein
MFSSAASSTRWLKRRSCAGLADDRGDGVEVGTGRRRIQQVASRRAASSNARVRRSNRARRQRSFDLGPASATARQQVLDLRRRQEAAPALPGCAHPAGVGPGWPPADARPTAATW